MYGWLNGKYGGYGWFGQHSSGDGVAARVFDYGYPAGAYVESDVVCQFIFEETTTGDDIVDTVSSITCPDVTSTVYPLYGQVPADSAWDPVSPGIQCRPTAEFALTTATASMSPGTGDFTVEWIMKWLATVTSLGYLFSLNNASTVRGLMVYYTGGTNTMNIYLNSETGSAINTAIVLTPDLKDGDVMKFRLTFDRSGNLELEINGASQGTASISALDGDTISNHQTRINGQYNGGSSVGYTTFYEWRLSHNITNDSLYPGAF